jgi:hypothetical protein
MSTKLDETPRAEQKKEEAGLLEAVIRENVLRGLGEPDNLHRVQVRQVFGGKYRVNVFVRADASTYKVAHSYFLEADSAGQVLTSVPAITRMYPAG